MKRILALLAILGLLLAAGSAPAEPLYKVDMTKLWPGLAKKADPSPAPAGDDFARFGGVWTLTEVTSGGQAINPAEMGITFTMTVRKDGTVTADMMGEMTEGTWHTEGETLLIEEDGATSTAELRDGLLAAETGDGTVMIFTRTTEPEDLEEGETPAETPTPVVIVDVTALPTEEPTPLITATPEPAKAPTPEPTPAVTPAPAAQEIRMEQTYVCVWYNVEGIRLDASTLGAPYSVCFHRDGTAEVTIAGQAIPDLTWKRDGDALVIDYLGNSLSCAPNPEGFAMDYLGVMSLQMAVNP